MRLLQRFFRRRQPVDEAAKAPPRPPESADFDASAALLDLAENGDLDQVLATLGEQLELFHKQGQVEAVEELLGWVDEAVGEAPSAGRLAQLGAVYQRLEEAGRKGHARRALELYGAALEQYRAAGIREGEAILLNNIGLAWCELAAGEAELYRCAIPPLEEALAFYQEHPDLSCRAAVCMALAGAYAGLAEAGPDHLELACEYGERAWALFERCGAELDQARAQGLLGEVQMGLAAYYGVAACERAARHFRNALTAFVEEGATLDCARYHAGLGRAYAGLGAGEHLGKAARAWERAAEMYAALGERSAEAAALAELGRVHRERSAEEGPECLVEALEYNRRALGAYQQLERPLECGRVLAEVARIYLAGEGPPREADLSQALRCLEEAAALLQSGGGGQEAEEVCREAERVRALAGGGAA